MRPTRNALGGRGHIKRGLKLAGLLVLGSTSWMERVQAQTLPLFRDGQAQVVPGFNDATRWIRHDLWVETEFDSDGDGNMDRVHVAVTRPGQTDSEDLTVPVVYETSPYYAGLGSTSSEFFWDVRQELGAPSPERLPMPSIQHRPLRTAISNSHVRDWVPRGFAVVHSESPGTGLSQGCPTIGGENETLAPKAVIDWLNQRARGFTTAEGTEEVSAYWSTGRVGMTGTSYNGTLPIAAATTGVEGLEAIIPIAPNTSYYHYYRSNGLVRSPGGYLGEDVDVLFDVINSGYPNMRPYCEENIRDGELALGFDRISGDYNEFWASRDYLNVIDGISAPTLMAHAFNDWNVMPEHSVRIYEALKTKGVPTQAYYHQGGHGGPPPFELMNRWFTRYVYGVENQVEEDPRAWIVREGDPPFDPTPYADYPNPEAVPVTLHLSTGGRSQGGLMIQPQPGQTRENLVDNVTFSGASLAQADSSAYRLMYATPELTEAVHLSGTPSVNMRLAVDREAANLSVWVVTLPWSDEPGVTGVITRGWADPQNHSSLRTSEPLVPDRFYDISFELQPDDQVIPSGRRLALMVFSSDREFTLWPEPGTELTIDLDGTSITLPVVGGEAALTRAFGQSSR